MTDVDAILIKHGLTAADQLVGRGHSPIWTGSRS